MKKRLTICFIAFCVVMFTQPVLAIDYAFTTLDFPGATSTRATGINDASQIVGTYFKDGVRNGFLFDSGSFSTINFPGATWTEPSDVNNPGQIIGSYGDATGTHGFLFNLNNGSFDTIDFPAGFPTFTYTIGINDTGQIVGSYGDAGGNPRGFLLDSGNFSIFDFPSANRTEATEINDIGQIVGWYQDASGGYHGFLLDGGSFSTIDFPGANYFEAAYGINDTGKTVGNYEVTNNDYHGFLLDGGSFSTIDFPDATQTSVTKINDASQIVGGYNDASGRHGFVATPNSPPVANAGPDQTVNEGTLVTLNGSGSSDPDGDSLTHQWTQIAGPPVTLNLADPVHPTFVAPGVPVGGATLTFQLTVSDGKRTSKPDTVDITVKNVNHLPTADAGADQTVAEGSPVMLDGSASFDLDGERLSYSWVQTAGPSVTLSSPTAAQPSFTAPLVGSGGASLTFALTVSDGMDSATDTVNVIVKNVNHPPTANAGADQTKNEGSLVTFNGTASTDPDGDSLSYTWTQLAGTPVTLSDPYGPAPTFTAPLVGPGGETLTFRLIVSDGLANSTPDEVTITVLNRNDPPAVDLAQASPAILSAPNHPPNHKLVLVEIVGVTDPDNDQVTITITGVTQDEPVNGLGDGDTSPDAVIQGDKVLLRAERAGNGNGRVYRVTFTATDGSGGNSTGAVTVCVPRDRRAPTCVDDGQFYNSL